MHTACTHRNTCVQLGITPLEILQGLPKVDHSGIDARTVLEQN